MSTEPGIKEDSAPDDVSVVAFSAQCPLGSRMNSGWLESKARAMRSAASACRRSTLQTSHMSVTGSSGPVASRWAARAESVVGRDMRGKIVSGHRPAGKERTTRVTL